MTVESYITTTIFAYLWCLFLGFLMHLGQFPAGPFLYRLSWIDLYLLCPVFYVLIVQYLKRRAKEKKNTGEQASTMFFGNVENINILVAAEDKESLLKTTESFVHNKQLAVNSYQLRRFDKNSSDSKAKLIKSLNIETHWSIKKVLLYFSALFLCVWLWGIVYNWILPIPSAYYHRPNFATDKWSVFFLFSILFGVVWSSFNWYHGRKLFGVAKKHLTNKNYFLLLQGERNVSWSIESNHSTLFCDKNLKQLARQVARKESSNVY